MIDPTIVCCYLHPITKHGYPPDPAQTSSHLRDMKALGFTSVELEGIHEQHLMAIYEQRHQIAEHLSDLGLRVPYFCVVLPGLSSADPDERAHNLRVFEAGCEVGAEFGALGVLDNAPIPPYRFDYGIPVTRHYDEDVLRNASLPPGLEWGRYWDELAATFAQACDIAVRFGLTYQIHPCLGALSSTADGYLVFRDAVDRPNLRFNLDTANLFALKDNPTLALLRLAGHVDYIHISDNRGHKVEHLVPGDGSIDWDNFFAALDRTGFEGHLGIDVGGAETGIDDIDDAYLTAARWLAERMQQNGIRNKG